MSFISTVNRLFHVKQPTRQAPLSVVKPPAAAPVDGFDAAPRPGPVTLAPVSPVAGPTASGAVDGVVSPYYQGRIGRDGRQFVGPTGQAFNYRGVSEFLLPLYLNDKSRSPEENEKLVGARMDERARQGYSVLRVFGTVPWDNATLKPFDDFDAYKANTEKLFSMAKDRGLYVEFTAFTGADKTVPPNKRGEYVDFVAQLAKKYDNSFVELCNESFQNGLSKDELYELGRRFKQTAPQVMLAGSSAQGDSIDGSAEDAAMFAKAPFDYVTLHSERADGDDGYRWVRHMREGEGVSSATGLPVVQDEPIGSSSNNIPGRRDNVGQHFRDGALVAAITGQGFTFHTERAVTVDPNARVGEPGADMTNVSDLVPADARGTHFVNGHWPESPLDVGNQFDSSVLRVFTRMKNDGSGFWTYPVQIKNDLDLGVKRPTHLTVKDVGTGEVLVDRDFAAGEKLHLARGSDVLIYGGNAEQPQVKKVGEPAAPLEPELPGSTDPLPAQRQTGQMKTAPYSPEAAQRIVERLYLGVLGRPADPDGLRGYAQLVANGQLRRVVNALVSSQEFANRKDSLTVGKLTNELYKTILDRAPDQGGREGTESLLRSGLLAERVTAMVTSSEYQEHN